MVTANHAQNVNFWNTISDNPIGGASGDTSGSNIAVAANYKAGAATATLTASFTGTAGQVSVGCDILAAAGAGFTPVYFEGLDSSTTTLPPKITATPQSRGAIWTSDQGTQLPPETFRPHGWPIAPPQPPSRQGKVSDAGAIMAGDQGTQAGFVRFLPAGWEVASPQPRHPRREAAGAIMPSEAGIEAKFVFVPPTTLPWGWEGQPPQMRRVINYGPAVGGSADFVSFFFQPFNWEIPSFQPPSPRPERAGAIATSEPGVEAKFIFNPPTVNWGWEGQPSLLTRRYLPQGRSMPDTGDQGTEAAFIRFLPSGWEVAPPLTRHQVLKSPEIGDQGTQTPFARFLPSGWEIAPVQPRHPRTEKAGAIMPWEQGIESQFVFVPPTPVLWGWDVAAPHLRKSTTTRYFGTEGTSDFASFDFQPYGWELPPFQPRHPRAERSGAIPTGDQGNLFPFTFVAPPVIIWGWDIAPFQPRHPRSEKAGSILAGDQGTQAPLINWVNFNWHVPPFQPPHPRPERSAAIMPWESGIEAVYVFVPRTFFPEGWQIPSFQPPSPAGRLDRFAGIVRGQDGTDLPFTRFLPSGWEGQPWQPPHPRPERAGAIMPWEAGIEAQYVFVPPAFLTTAWEVQAWQPPHPRPERWAAMARGDDGTQSPFVRFLPSGWEVQPFQPPHPRPEKSGAVMPSEPGIEARYVFVPPPFFTMAWEVAPFQPPHPRVEKFGAVVRGDEGMQARFIRWFNMGWEIPPYQPPHPRPERAGAIMAGHQGIDDLYVFVPPALHTVDVRYITYAQPRVTITYPRGPGNVTFTP